MSFFSKKVATRQENSEYSGIIIKTMQDDLNAFNNITLKENSSPQTTTPQFTVSKPVQGKVNNIPEATFINKNPFTSQEQFIDTPPLFTNQTQEIKIEKEAISPIQIYSSPLKLIISFIILIVLTSVGGIYYFIIMRGPNTVQNTIKGTLGLFSTESANYLSINTNTSTPKIVQTILSQTAQSASTFNSVKPLEFLITDASNIPLSFTSFAKFSGIKLSQTTLNSLGDTFSLFIYTNNHISNIGISIEIKDKMILQESLKKEEPTLIQTLSPLFLGNAPTQFTGSFNNGVYKNISLRYINIHPDTSLSLDYAITDKYLIIGTSMETHHALLDSIQ